MNIGLLIVGLAVVTFAVRLWFIALEGRWTMPLSVQRPLQFVPVAVLSALVLPDLVYVKGVYEVSPFNPRLIAGIVAALVAWKTKNTILTIVVGMVTLFGVQAVTLYLLLILSFS